MVTCFEIQNRYNKLYAAIRNYLLDFKTVEKLADLEVACYRAVPDLKEIRRVAHDLHRMMDSVLKTDEDLSKAFKSFQSFIDSDDNVYCPIKNTCEV